MSETPSSSTRSVTRTVPSPPDSARIRPRRWSASIRPPPARRPRRPRAPAAAPATSRPVTQVAARRTATASGSVAVVDDEQPGASVADPADDLDPRRRRRAAASRRPRRAPAAPAVDAALRRGGWRRTRRPSPTVVAGDRRDARQRAVDVASPPPRRRPGAGARSRRRPTAPSSSVHPSARPRQRVELLDAHAQQLAERARVAAETDLVVLVDDAGEVGDERPCAPASTAAVEPRGGGVGDEVERRHHDEPVAARSLSGCTTSTATPVRQRAVQASARSQVAHVDRSGGRRARRPTRPGSRTGSRRRCRPALPATSASRPSSWRRARRPRATPGCRCRRAGPSPEWNFSAPAREARHWKNSTAVGAAGDVLQAVAHHLAGRLGEVARLPVDRARRVLHQQPRAGRRPSPRVRSALNASSRWPAGSAAP